MMRELVDPSNAYIDMSEDELFSLWTAYYPAGSRPLGSTRTVCALIESIAVMRGMCIEFWPARYEAQRK